MVSKQTLAIFLISVTIILGTLRIRVSEFILRPPEGAIVNSPEGKNEPIDMLTLWEGLWLDRIPRDPQRPTWNMTKAYMNMTLDRLYRIVEGTPISEEISSLFQTLKIPSRQNSISLYNETAYNDLISNLIQSHMEGRQFTIVASGASTTAGARSNRGDSGSLPKEKRYYSKLADYFNALLPPTNRSEPTVISMGQGHGSRKSFHTAIFYESFIPSNTDIILWEFSVNDATNAEGNHSQTLRRCQLNLLTFLHEVRKRKQPPKVILLYYWNTPYATYKKKIGSTAFDALGDIGRQFDNVIGHVNMAAYIEESRYLRCRIWQTCIFLSDKHHASEIGHFITAFMIFNLMDPSKQSLLPLEPNKLHPDLYKHEWVCGTETPAKKILQQAITNSSTGWKSPVGAWTLELPDTEDYSGSRRLIAAQSNWNISIMGKQDPMRQDRQRCTPLTYCGSDPSTLFSVLAPREPMKDVRVILFNIQPRLSVLENNDIGVHINNSSAVTNGTLVPVRAPNVNAWPCPFAWSWGVTVDTYFFVFEEPISVVHSVGLCTASKMQTPPMIQSVVLW